MDKHEVELRIKSLRKSKINDPVNNYIVSDSRNCLKTGGSKNKIEFKHLICGNKFSMAYYNFISGQGCPYCYGNHNKITYEHVKNIIEADGKYKLISTEYKNAKEKMSIYDITNNTYLKINYDSWCKGVRTNRTALTSSEIAESIHNIDNEYECTDLSAKHFHDMIQIKHLNCGNVFTMQYNNFKNGERCPLCAIKNASGNISKAVKQIISILEDKNIDFELEKKFDDLKEIKKLRYDFYIKSKNLLLEYQGQQHFIYYKTGFFTKDKFDEIKKHDSIKLKYANDNGINIEYITYADDIAVKLDEILNKY